MQSPQDKILTIPQLKNTVETLHNQGKTTVFTNGCFDLLHRGHTSYLREAKKQGDFLIIGVNSDNSVRKLKGASRPIVPLEERMEMLACFYFVDYVCYFDEDTPCNLISKIKPKIYVKGGDWKIESLPENAIVQAYGGRVAILLEIADKSTTNIIHKIQGK